jgi:broad specificity phosphatase PhoE
MTTIYLIRHGQASIGTANYDVLSTLGKQQSGILGEHLRQLNINFDGVYSGTLQRQRDTATIALQRQKIEPVTVAGFNEYHHAAIYQHYAPKLANSDVFKHHNDKLNFETFAALMNAWAQDKSPQDSQLETFAQFCARIQNGFEEILAQHADTDTIAVFTSGGVICTLLQSILHFPVARIFEINWGIYNASISKIKIHRNEMKFRDYNNITHLLLQQDNSLITNI